MIDWAQIEELSADMGEGFDDLVAVFLDEVDTAMARLDAAAPDARIAADLHFLKGAALNLGFAEFAALCSVGETRAREGGTVDLGPIRASFTASREAFLVGLAERRAA